MGEKPNDDGPIQLTFGRDDPENVGKCTAITFVIERRGNKMGARVVQKRTFENGTEALSAIKEDELKFQAQYKRPVGSVFFSGDGKTPDYLVEQHIRRIIRAHEDQN